MDETEKIREVMSILGSRTSEKKKKQSADNGRASADLQRGRVFSAETRAKMKAAQAARRAREAAEETT